ncbi:MAG TPA: GNAT family protein [Thermoclostridium sp.]|nr:GNAT family protein [Thermoclostridium sp.]HPU45829.1 GNAT family protein [Thermoclostridium sp.]
MRYFSKLVGENILLSPINIDDLEQYTAWLNDLSITINLGNASTPISLASEKEFLEKLTREGHNYAIVLKENETLIGNCSLFNINPIHRTAETGIFIGDEKHRGKGYGTEAMMLLLAYGFKVLNLNNIMLKVFSFNQRAIKSYEKAGFRVIGRRSQAYQVNGKHYDEVFMEILAQDFRSTLLDDVLP